MTETKRAAAALETRGPLAWTAVLGGIAWWLAHLTLSASVVEAACRRPVLIWVVHGATVATAAATAAGMVWCERLRRAAVAAGDDDDGADDDGGAAARAGFVARFGLAVGATSLVLILLEGAYALGVDPCA